MAEQTTPTTEDVRSTFQWGSNACGCCATYDDRDGEDFDRWLAAHDAQVAKNALLTWKRMFEGYTLDFSSGMSMYDHTRRLLERDAAFIGDRIEGGTSVQGDAKLLQNPEGGTSA